MNEFLRKNYSFNFFPWIFEYKRLGF